MIVDGVEIIRVALKQLDKSIQKMQQQIEIIKMDRVWGRIKKIILFHWVLKVKYLILKRNEQNRIGTKDIIKWRKK